MVLATMPERPKPGNYFGKAYQEYGDKICFATGIDGEYSYEEKI
jgi:hypothetical protein